MYCISNQLTSDFNNYCTTSLGIMIKLCYLQLILDYVSLDLLSVTTTESADVALSLFRAHENHYNLVIANLCMPEMKFSKFVQELHQQQKNIPVICKLQQLTVTIDVQI